jgi:ATP adenylyltransferase
MDYLWTPWRYQYISTTRTDCECIFCAAARSGDDRASLVVYRGERNFVILNRYPYTSGHLMVVPYQHAPSLVDLPEPTVIELMLLARTAEAHLREVYRPEGLNIGINIGKSAGAGVAGHVHLHALPRWHGDVNFMTAVGETRVVPEDLETTWARLRDAFCA